MTMPDDRRSNLPASQALPRGLYGIIVALAGWLVLSVWGFAGDGDTGLVLAVVSLFIGIAVGLSLLLAAIHRRHHRQRPDDGEASSLTEWLGRDFESHTGRLKGAAAAAQILLPLAAVAFGMTIFALVRHLGGVV